MKQARGLRAVVDVYHHTDHGRLGLAVLDAAAPLVDALHLMAAGRAWQAEQDQSNGSRR